MSRDNEKEAALERLPSDGAAVLSQVSKPSILGQSFSDDDIRPRLFSVSTSEEGGHNRAANTDSANGSTLLLPLPQVFTNVQSVLSTKVVTFLGLRDVFQLCDQFQIKLIETGKTDVHLYIVTGEYSALVALEQHIRGLLNVHSNSQSYAAVFSSEFSAGIVPRRPPPGLRRTELPNMWDRNSTRDQQPCVSEPKFYKVPDIPNSREQVTNPSLLVSSKYECDRMTYDVMVLTAQEQLKRLKEECKVSIRICCASDSDKKTLCLTVAGKSADSQISQGLEKLKKLCSRVEARISKSEMEVSKSMVPAVRKVNWSGMRTVVTFERSRCILFGLREDVLVAEKILKQILRNLTTFFVGEVDSEAFMLQSGHVVIVKNGNITREKADIIVNAANRQLKHSGGVAKAICLAAGTKAFQKESREFIRRNGEVKDGEAVITGAGSLNCKMVVHAVAPQWSKDESEQKRCGAMLRKLCYNCLKLTDENQGVSVAIPGLGSGTFGIPKLTCAQALVAGAEEFFRDRPTSCIRLVVFIDMDKATVGEFQSQARKRFGDGILASQMLSETNQPDMTAFADLSGTEV